MNRKLFTALSAISLLVSLWLVCSPRLTSAGHFWLSFPLDDLGPFDNADECFLFGFAILFAAPAVLCALLALNRVGEAVLYPPPPVGCCRKCGYDLRASKERCPECGTAITASAGAMAP